MKVMATRKVFDLDTAHDINKTTTHMVLLALKKCAYEFKISKKKQGLMAIRCGSRILPRGSPLRRPQVASVVKRSFSSEANYM